MAAMRPRGPCDRDRDPAGGWNPLINGSRWLDLFTSTPGGGWTSFDHLQQVVGNSFVDPSKWLQIFESALAGGWNF